MEDINPEFYSVNLKGLTNIKVSFLNSEYVITLIDSPDIEVLKGYGKNITDAMNDLFSNLI
ncbi:hypothetical protein JCM19275_3439 [Nonlabens ulvanivorans]|uniref:Uncharacterized protein n=1 Tax=Nonlabens ulvanivorans TaxID=906888 RepID=A0A090WGS5_NONUL|nr:hypothetical protein JCM19275_3439 [Nonlabens ulvanivorans]